MKLTYAQTNGYDLIVATNGKTACCLTEHDFERDFSAEIDELHEKLNDRDFRAAVDIAAEMLYSIEENMSYAEMMSEWDTTNYDGSPFTAEQLLENCDIIAEIEA